MKASYIETCGPPENIRFGDVADPTVGPGQVLVRTRAVAVNPIDTYIRGGANYWALPNPYIVGCDIAGRVEAVGPDVAHLQVGDRVWGSNQGLLGKQGTFAELCAIDEQWLYPTPDGIDDRTVAACSLVGITAHLGLFSEAQLRPGETILVQGGSGGVGSMVVQMAKAIGARVITSAGSDDKVACCRAHGADEVVNYKSDDLAAAVADFAPEGVNVIWETQREPDFDLLISCLSERGRIVVMAGRDARPPFPVGPFYVKCCSIHGFVMFKASPEQQRHAANQINQWLIEEKLKPQIGLELPLSKAAEAPSHSRRSDAAKNG